MLRLSSTHSQAVVIELKRDMNSRQEIVLFFIVAAFVATLIFPPWIITRYDTGTYSQSYPPTPWPQNIGYRSIFTWPPSGLLGNDFHTIDWSRLFLGDLIIVVAGGWLLWVLRSRS